MPQNSITTKWFGFEGKIPSTIQGIIYGFGFVLLVIIALPWIVKVTTMYWDWVDHVRI